MMNVNSADGYCGKGPKCHLPPSSGGYQHLDVYRDDTFSFTNPQTACSPRLNSVSDFKA